MIQQIIWVFSAEKKSKQKMLLQITDTIRAKTHDSLDDFDTFDSKFTILCLFGNFFSIYQHVVSMYFADFEFDIFMSK